MILITDQHHHMHVSRDQHILTNISFLIYFGHGKMQVHIFYQEEMNRTSMDGYKIGLYRHTNRSRFSPSRTTRVTSRGLQSNPIGRASESGTHRE
uniref:Uncharacterized protein n=1 Tax=Triticum urartu TaxID=4572 RepID=A0A8R7U4U7_TRIUA